MFRGAASRPIVSRGTSESAEAREPWLPPPRWLRPARSANSTPSLAEMRSSPAFGLLRAAQARAKASGCGRSAGSPLVFQLLAAGANRNSSPARRANRLSALEEEHRLGAGLGVEACRQFAGVLPGLSGPVDHAGPVGRGHDHTRILEPVLQPHCPFDPRLSMVGAEHHRVSLQELVRAACRLDQGPDRRVAPGQSLGRRPRTGRVRGEVVVRQVVDEEIEAVARDEPAADGGQRRRRSSRSSGRRRRAGTRHVRLEQVEEEEALRPKGWRPTPGTTGVWRTRPL